MSTDDLVKSLNAHAANLGPGFNHGGPARTMISAAKELHHKDTIIAELVGACQNQTAWIERLLLNLEYRVTQQSERGHGGNGFAFSAVPDWDLRQKLESLKEDIAHATAKPEEKRKVAQT